jgi:feruloyl esterase
MNHPKKAALLRAWQNLCAKAERFSAASLGTVPALPETLSFGSNPGRLRMFSHRPAAGVKHSALVVVLHGCGQTAAGYNHGAGWSTLADRYGFALLLPEQQPSNNPNTCFNWFLPEHTQRDRGEALSIRQMIETMVRQHAIDPDRIFITGLSAGGAMTSVMLACYPEVFAGGAIIAGLPYGAAGNVQQAFASMFQCPSRPARAWGDLVRAASAGHAGPWPKLSVWHGQNDTTVIPANAREILKQWTDVHGLPLQSSSQSLVDGHPRQVWCDPFGEAVIESYAIHQMAHGTPLATIGTTDSACGTAGPFLLDVGISSSYHIAKFFGLTTGASRAVPAQAAVETAGPATLETAVSISETADEERPEAFRSAGPRQGPGWAPSPYSTISKTITDALTAAGLMKR